MSVTVLATAVDTRPFQAFPPSVHLGCGAAVGGGGASLLGEGIESLMDRVDDIRLHRALRVCREYHLLPLRLRSS